MIHLIATQDSKLQNIEIVLNFQDKIGNENVLYAKNAKSGCLKQFAFEFYHFYCLWLKNVVTMQSYHFVRVLKTKFARPQ